MLRAGVFPSNTVIHTVFHRIWTIRRNFFRTRVERLAFLADPMHRDPKKPRWSLAGFARQFRAIASLHPHLGGLG